MNRSDFSRLLTVGTVLIFFLSVATVDLQASEQSKTLPFGMPHFSYNKLSQIPPVRAINPTRVAGYQVKAVLASLQYVANEDPVTGGGGGGSGTTATTTSASYDLEIVSGEATSLGFKFNFCNNGDTVANFPVDIYVGPTVRTFDLIGLQTAHTCQSHTWTYGVWGLTNTAGNTYSVEVDINLRHTIAETNENNNTTQMVLTVPSSTVSPDLNIAELTVTMLDSSIPTSRRVYWRSTIAAGVGEYRYTSSSSELSTLPWRSDGVVDGPQTGNIFGSQLDFANLTPGMTYYIEVRKLYNGTSGRVYGNSLSTSFTIASATTTLCAGPGLRADIYGGPNQVCCAGLVLEGGVCNQPTATTTQPIIEKFVVCHLNSANNYTVLKISKDGWENGHRQHSGDFIKVGEGTCEAYASKNTLVPDSGIQDDGPTSVPKLIRTPQALDQTLQDTKDELIRHLQSRIQKLERTVTALEQQVTQREVERETTIDRKLTDRLEGMLLLQTERHGEVWWVLPDVGQKIYLQNGDGAYEAMRTFGLGISENDFKNIDKIGNDHKGEVLLRVQAHGEAYYIDDKGTPHYLKDGNAAYEIMKDQALGINDRDLSKIPTGKFYTETTVSQ